MKEKSTKNNKGGSGKTMERTIPATKNSTGSTNSNSRDPVEKKIATESLMTQFSSSSAQVVPARGVLRLVALISAFILIIFLFALSYRSIGYIAINRTYSCVQNDLDSISYINTMIDVETGIQLVDSQLVVDEVNQILQNIQLRECGLGMSSIFARDLEDSQIEVEDTAIQYLEAVISVAEAPTQEAGSEVADRYDIFRQEVAEFEEDVAVTEGKFFVAL